MKKTYFLYNYEIFYKSKKYFIINMGIHTMTKYFALCLLINGYKNIYSHNDYLLELLLLKVIFSKKRELCVCLQCFL